MDGDQTSVRPAGRLARWLASRTLARTAIAGTAVGIATLATMAVLTAGVTVQATAQVHRVQDFNRVWNALSTKISTADTTLRAYLATEGTRYRREQLTVLLRSTQSDIDWLLGRGAVVAGDVAVLQAAFRNYHFAVREATSISTARANAAKLGDRASQRFTVLRSVVLDNIRKSEDELSAYLQGAVARTAVLRLVALIAIPSEVLLFGICALVLIGYQRGAEQQAADRLRDATHDPLTGLGNRTMLADRLQAAISDSDSTDNPFCLLLIDLDRFKEVNDTLGHHCGDELLVTTARRLLSASRATDTVARLGGDEFAVVLPMVSSRERAVEVASRLLAAMREPVRLDGILVDIDASIGLSMYPGDGSTPAELLKHADVAMYVAKRSCGGVAEYDPGQDEHTPGKLRLQSDLREGIERGELVGHYQPKVDLHSGRTTGAEALVRWRHPEQGLLSPAAFIPAAEESGLIDLVTVNVLDQALRQVAVWSAAGHRLPVSVNVPARALADLTFPDTVVAALTRHGVAPELLILEITESSLIVDPQRAREVLDRLHAARVDISIDDFGTGYSSLAHLRDLPQQELKIDRSLVSTMCEQPRDEWIVRAVIDLAKGLQMRVVAEGVETEQAMSTLTARGCDEAQGFLISKPLPADEFTAWLVGHTVAEPAGATG
ncbi:MAG TPA: EAL domain-containing protein [Actinoplanes sp.]|nr:EAL domain-containing protein [Actinoplanes sp.]